jgi:RND family efflux transporter MFP subunit
MNRQVIWSVGLLFAATVIAFAMYILRPQPQEQEVVASVPLVETAIFTVESGPLQVLGSGTVQPREEVTLGAEVSGRIIYVSPSFREGGTVREGEVLFRIDDSDFRNRVRSAQADVAAQEVAVLQAQEEMTIAARELQRFANRDGARSETSSGQARILPPGELETGSTLAASTSEPNILATREPQLRSAEAARDRALAQLADAELALSRTEVRSPFNGLVRSESLSVGTLVQPGQSLGSIVASNAFEVRVSLTEDEAGLVPTLFAAGGAATPASVEMEFTGARWRWDSVVDRADAILDPETRTIDVFLRVANPMQSGVMVGDGEGRQVPPLLLGSFVNATITGVAGEPFAAVPLDALREGDTVWLLAQGKLRIVPVHVIQRTDRMAYVSGEGLGQGGHVITSGLRTPVEGMELRSETSSGDSAGE